MPVLLIFVILLCTYAATHERLDDKTKAITFVGSAVLMLISILLST